jgi:Zn-dependent M32 family carboxypeptidase
MFSDNLRMPVTMYGTHVVALAEQLHMVVLNQCCCVLQVRKGLVPLLAELREKGSAPDDSWLHGSYNLDKQAALCKEVALQLGFDTNNGRLDVSVHPFTGVCCG